MKILKDKKYFLLAILSLVFAAICIGLYVSEKSLYDLGHLPLSNAEVIQRDDFKKACSVSRYNFMDFSDEADKQEVQRKNACEKKEALDKKESLYSFQQMNLSYAYDRFINRLCLGLFLIWMAPFVIKWLSYFTKKFVSYFSQKFLPSLNDRKKRVAFVRLCVGFGLVVVGIITSIIYDEFSFAVLFGASGIVSMLIVWAGLLLISVSALRIWTKFYDWLDQE